MIGALLALSLLPGIMPMALRGMEGANPVIFIATLSVRRREDGLRAGNERSNEVENL